MKKSEIKVNPNRTEANLRPRRNQLQQKKVLSRKSYIQLAKKKERNKKIIAMSKDTPQNQISKLMKVSRQRIFQIIQREKAVLNINSKNQTP